MTREFQYLPVGKNAELIKNYKSNFLKIKDQPQETSRNHSLLKVSNKTICLGEPFQYVDLIEMVKSPVGIELTSRQIDRLIEQKVIKVSGINLQEIQIGTYIVSYEYYSHKKGALLTVVAPPKALLPQVNSQSKVKTKLDLTRYYRYAGMINHKKKLKGDFS